MVRVSCLRLSGVDFIYNERLYVYGLARAMVVRTLTNLREIYGALANNTM